MSGQVSRGSVAEYQADERAEVARLSRSSAPATYPHKVITGLNETRCILGNNPNPEKAFK